MLPSHLDGGFHIVRQDYKLRWPAVVIGAEAHDVDLSQSGRENSEKTRREQGGILRQYHNDGNLYPRGYPSLENCSRHRAPEGVARAA